MRRTQVGRTPVIDDRITEENRRLKEELNSARRDIIGLMPDHYHEQLASYDRCTSSSEINRWSVTVVEQIIDLVPPEALTPSYVGSRVDCPLCKSSDHTFPEGLRRHLVGRGNSQQCPVTKAATWLAQSYSERHFAEADRRKADRRKQEVDAATAQRRTTELLYLLGPNDVPVMVDEESLRFPGLVLYETRLADGLAWAESRLQEIGFVARTDGRARSYTLEMAQHVVYADIRYTKKITFNIFPLSPKKKEKRPAATIELLDNRKNDLKARVHAMLEDALKRVQSREK